MDNHRTDFPTVLGQHGDNDIGGRWQARSMTARSQHKRERDDAARS
jgi:hypothetical protein